MTCTDKAAEIKGALLTGDRVELVGEIVSGREGEYQLCFLSADNRQSITWWVGAPIVRAGRRVARPLAIGDRVKFKAGQGNTNWRGLVKAIDDGCAWVLDDPGRAYSTIRLDALERAPAPYSRALAAQQQDRPTEGE